MTRLFIIQSLIISGVVIFYFIFTLRYFIGFRKNTIFTGAIKTFHLIMMWIVPFIWILLLKALTKSTSGSYEIEKKEDPEPFSKSGYDTWHT